MTSIQYWQLAVPCPLRQLFTYAADDALGVRPGDWVTVPFGRRQVRALVIESEPTPSGEFEIRSILELAQPAIRVPDELLELIIWATRYYHVAPWDVVNSFVPSRILQGKLPGGEFTYQAAAEGEAKISAKAARQKALWRWLMLHPNATAAQIRAGGFSATVQNEAEKIGAIERKLAEPAKMLTPPTQLLTPTSAQREAIDAVQGEGAWLLEGVTGSGKSLIYQYLASDALQSGGQVLVLVPEIGLIPQMQDHLACLGHAVSTYHSGMTDSERAQVWLGCHSGLTRLVVGTRSSLFLPMPDLALMIVDEEHDSSYKQQEGIRYQARDLAVYRASKCQIPLVLASATPSLESRHNVARARFGHLQLRERVAGGQLPVWQVLPAPARANEAAVSDDALEQIRVSIAQGDQVLVFLNRRGYAPCLQCNQCGWQARCRQCEVRLTWHRSLKEMRCHQCDSRSPVPHRCEQCGSAQLQSLGEGTERIEEFLAREFPDAAVIRIDRDATRGRDGIKNKIGEVHRAGPAILVGTQMLAKGHHFPRLCLALILDIDVALQSADFRAAEQAMQLVTQVAGRTGRESRQGRVLLQTRLPGHPLLKYLFANDYAAFADAELEKRHSCRLPPFFHMAIFRAESTRAEEARDILAHAVLSARSSDCQLIGPFPAMIEKRQGRYRYVLQVLSKDRSKLHQAVDRMTTAMQSRPSRQLRWHLDVDPVSMD